MKTKSLQFGKAMSAALFVLLLSVAGTMNAFAQERSLPTVTTTAVTKSGNNVVSGGNVTDDGGSPVTTRGICYGSNPSPDLSASFTHTEDGTGTGVFTSVIAASATGTIYIRAYATNANGTAYGDELSVNVDYYRLPRFEYNGLTYVVAPDPQSTSSTEYISYSAALSYCENLTAYGYSDWVMPDIYELEMMWQNRTSIGGFIQGTTSNPMCYHSSTYYGSTGHYKLVWLTGGRVQNANLENIGCVTATSGGVTATFRCHVRPIRKEIFLPSVTTNDVTNITYTSATFGGIVTDDGGATVTERGICWGSRPNPTINDLHSNSGTGTGNYTITYGSLTPGTQYYVRAYATNSVGTAYGNEVSFTTDVYGVPTVTTSSVFDITTTTAKGGGNVINSGGYALTEKGICWSTSHNPTTYNTHVNYYNNNVSSYTLNMTGLIPGTQYYVRAYATNSMGTGYGDEVTFTTTSPPTVTTNNVTDITPNSAVCGGNVTAEGSGSVTARGVCWSTSPSPTTSNSHTNNGTGTGSFTSNITGLNQNTLYYVRAYATNSEGTAYGEEVSFTTTKWLDVTTNNVTYITQTSATCGGYAIAYNGATVTDRGVCWSTTSQTPTVSDNHTSSGTGSGSFTSNLTGLTQNTTYYVRAYATCSGGTVYGETKQFTTTKFEYRISEGGVVATSAGGYFYDSGGPDGYFYSNEQYIMTFMSNQGAGTKIQMMFIEFSLYNYWDASLMIYDGVNTSAPLIGTYRSYESPGTITATNSDGALTFVFISNDDGYGWGWKAAISIVTPDYLIDVSANPSNGGTVSGGGYFDYGENCTLTATPAAGYTFVNWTENGNVVSSNANYSFTVNSSRNLVANFAEEGSNCFLVFDLMDSYGDGWNGAKLNVSFSDGSPSQSLTFTSGYNASYVIAANDGANVTLSWTQGSYDSECSFKVKYEDGPQIYQYSYPNSNFTYTFQMDCSSSNNPITFADATVKALCVANWDTNGDGELSYAEAAAVANLGEVFKNNSSITYFNELQYFTGLTSIGNYAFQSCSSLASVSIPNSATSIGSYAFNGCSNLTSVNIPISVTSIGSNAFAGCSSLTSISLPVYLTSIGNNGFFACTSLTSIVIPRYVTSLGTEVFRDCPGLAHISVNGNNTVYDSRNNCKAIIKTATNELLYGCKNTVIPNTVTSIGGAFDGCNSLTSIEIPSSVTSIGNYAFYNCTALTSMTVFADNPPTIGSSVFTNVNKSIPVYVPCGAVESYQETVGWNEFTNFIELCTYEITATANPVDGGNVTGTGTYNQGTTCTLTAMARVGYTFSNWTENGSVVSTNANYSFTVNANRSLVANFHVQLQVNAQYYPDASSPNSPYVKVHWGEIVTTSPDECFESGDFSLYGWELDSNYPWSITTYQPYEGTYCMKSGGSGVGNVVSNMTVTVYIPNNGIMSFFSKISSERYWDWGYFYIDGVQKCSYSGAGNWNETTFDITAGTHTFKWAYTKDSSVNSNDDCFYVDNITFYREAKPGWRTYCTNEFDDALGSNQSNTPSWAYEYPASYLGSNYAGWQITKVSLFSDNQYSSVGGNYTCRIYVGGTEPATGTLASTLTVDVPSNQNDWVDWDLTTPVNVTGNDPIWVVWTANSTMSNYPAGFSRGNNNSCGNWWYGGDGNGWTHSSYGVWTMRQWFTNRPNECFQVYRANCDGSGSTIVANNITGDEYIDTSWSGLATGNYIYGVCTSGSNAIYWSNCIERPIFYQITASANPTTSGTVTGGGTYTQGTTCTLTATPASGFTFVNWTENGEVVSTDASYSFVVEGSRNLVANFGLGDITNHWIPVQTFENTMDGIGIVRINGVEQMAALELGIFCGEECRGSVLPEEEGGHWLYYFSMGGVAGETFTFRLYDHTQQQELDLACSNEVSFEANAFLGDWDEPYEFLFSSNVPVTVTVNPVGAGEVTGAGEYPYGATATLTATANTGFAFRDWSINGEAVSTEPVLTLTVEAPTQVTANFDYTQEYSFSTGWNWWGTYIELSGIDGLTMLEEGLGESGVMIKTNGAYARKRPNNTWFGSLNSINNETGYKVQTSSNCTMAMTGSVAVPANHPIAISAGGWTWIGYPVQPSQSANAALSGFSPENKDIIKGQNGYARFDANTNTWKPTSFTLMPGKSYLYYSNATEAKSLVWTVGRSSAITSEQMGCNWKADVYAYPDNSSIQAVVLVDGEELRDEGYELGAFVDDVCRGSVRLSYDEYYDRYFAMLTVTGEDDDDITFGLADWENGEFVTRCETRMRFVSDGIVGDFEKPYEIRFTTKPGNSTLRIYPNPTDCNTPCTLDLPTDEVIEEVAVYNALGNIVMHKTGSQASRQIHGILTTGIYMVKVVCFSGNIYMARLVVK